MPRSYCRSWLVSSRSSACCWPSPCCSLVRAWQTRKAMRGASIDARINAAVEAALARARCLKAHRGADACENGLPERQRALDGGICHRGGRCVVGGRSHCSPQRAAGGAAAVDSMSSKRFKLGKYDIVAQPIAGSSHMLRYTVLLDGKRLGALFSVPCESDCNFLESPPPVPPLKIFSVTYCGRPSEEGLGAPASAGYRRPRRAAVDDQGTALLDG